MFDTQRSVSVLLLFADEDEQSRLVLLRHLSSLKDDGRITLWDVHQVAAGTDCVAAVEDHLKWRCR